MKVSAEEYLGMLVAVETSLKFDEDAEFNRQMGIVTAMGDDLSAIPGVESTTHIPGAEAREPYIEVRWNTDQYRISVAAMKQALREGSPSIEIRALFLSAGMLHLTATMLRPGEEKEVVRRVREVLLQSA